MNNNPKHIALASAAALATALLGSCGSAGKASSAASDGATSATIATQPMPSESAPRPVSMVPRAVVYRTTGDYRLNVPVTMNESRTSIVSFPDPSDLRRTDATPVELSGGYLLDRRGVTRNTAFLSYTYDEYAALKAVPPLDTLMARIIDRRPMAEIHVLPITAAAAKADPKLCEQYIANGFDGCDQAPTAPRVLKGE